MGTTPDCGPHCRAETATTKEWHCSCSMCHGKPVNVYYGGSWTPEGWSVTLEAVSAYPSDLKASGLCLNSRTPLRRTLIRLFSLVARPPRWLTAYRVWKICGLLEWLHWRAEELAMELEMIEDVELDQTGTRELLRVPGHNRIRL